MNIYSIKVQVSMACLYHIDVFYILHVCTSTSSSTPQVTNVLHGTGQHAVTGASIPINPSVLGTVKLKIPESLQNWGVGRAQALVKLICDVNIGGSRLFQCPQQSITKQVVMPTPPVSSAWYSTWNGRFV